MSGRFRPEIFFVSREICAIVLNHLRRCCKKCWHPYTGMMCIQCSPEVCVGRGGDSRAPPPSSSLERRREPSCSRERRRGPCPPPSNAGERGESVALWLPLLERGGKSLAPRLPLPSRGQGSLNILEKKRGSCPLSSNSGGGESLAPWLPLLQPSVFQFRSRRRREP